VLGQDELARRAKTVLFDEGHGERLWWILGPTVDKGYRKVRTITERHLAVSALATGQVFSPWALQGFSALILAIGPQKSTVLTKDEIAAVQDFVRRGGGLLVLGAYTGDWHHEANLNQLLEEYGIAFSRDVVTKSVDDGFKQGAELLPSSSCAVEAFPVNEGTQPAVAAKRDALLKDMSVAITLSSCSLYVNPDVAIPILQSSPESVILEPVPWGIGIRIQRYQKRGQGPVILAAASKTHKVVVVGSWKMFLDDFVDDTQHQNGQFYQQILDWLEKPESR
jgi:hypothetical protein